MQELCNELFCLPPETALELAATKESMWLRIASLRVLMGDRDEAYLAYEKVLRHNPNNVVAMTQVGVVLTKNDEYQKAIKYLQKVTSVDPRCGEAWAVLAHAYVMIGELGQAYEAYQNALVHLTNPSDPNLWYGIGLLYDRYGSLDNTREAFQAVLNICPTFDRHQEVCFCIGIIYKELHQHNEAIEYFSKVLESEDAAAPLSRADAYYQIGHVNELKKDADNAVKSYMKAIEANPDHARTLQQLGWLLYQRGNADEALQYSQRSVDVDPGDGHSWYLLGRVHMSRREFGSAADAYQQAVRRDGKNPTFWCSIGVLYYQMAQYRDAMDAYSRAIRLNPYISEVWYDLGSLYECCKQIRDAMDAYLRALELCPDNPQVRLRISLLEKQLDPESNAQEAGRLPPTSDAFNSKQEDGNDGENCASSGFSHSQRVSLTVMRSEESVAASSRGSRYLMSKRGSNRKENRITLSTKLTSTSAARKTIKKHREAGRDAGDNSPPRTEDGKSDEDAGGTHTDTNANETNPQKDNRNRMSLELLNSNDIMPRMSSSHCSNKGPLKGPHVKEPVDHYVRSANVVDLASKVHKNNEASRVANNTLAENDNKVAKVSPGENKPTPERRDPVGQDSEVRKRGRSEKGDEYVLHGEQEEIVADPCPRKPLDGAEPSAKQDSGSGEGKGKRSQQGLNKAKSEKKQ
mmetsp:Transcript_16312/g.42001  ORF Transcript_16312/g.42001 Transcript_16312/m.42001 type:complete len:690 (-) Transcript_16312:403-2472(-)